VVVVVLASLNRNWCQAFMCIPKSFLFRTSRLASITGLLSIERRLRFTEVFGTPSVPQKSVFPDGRESLQRGGRLS
jgi:hypothetical protein